jgi:hypothetical protein
MEKYLFLLRTPQYPSDPTHLLFNGTEGTHPGVNRPGSKAKTYVHPVATLRMRPKSLALFAFMEQAENSIFYYYETVLCNSEIYKYTENR